VVSFTVRPLYPEGKSPWYPLDRRPGGPQGRFGRGGIEKNSQPLAGLEPLIIQPVAQRYTNELSRLQWRHIPCLLKHHPMKTYWVSGRTAPRINLGTTWRWVVNFTIRPLYSCGKRPRFPWDWKLGGPQSQSGRSSEEKNAFIAPAGNWTPVVRAVACHYWATPCLWWNSRGRFTLTRNTPWRK
jgi:hypothetical protein